MSYSLERLPDGRYRLDIDNVSVCLSTAEFSDISARIGQYEYHEAMARAESENKEMESRLLAFEGWKDLPHNSVFRASIERGEVLHQVISAIRYGLLIPNGSTPWSAYFSKIDLKNDGHLFEPSLRKIYGDDALDHLLKYGTCSASVAILRCLTPNSIEDINRRAGIGTRLVNIGLTDSRDYTPLSCACARVYGYEKKESCLIVDVDFAKENLPTFIDVLYDAAVFIYQNVERKRSPCPGIEHWATESGIRESAKSIAYLSKYFNERHWIEICESEIWLLVKDIVSVRRHKDAA